nr:sensor histidine kinase [Paenibacillus dakarensis]
MQVPNSPRKMRFMPFGYKLMLTYMVFIIIPMIAIGYFSNSMYQNSIRKHTRNNIQGTITQIKDNIEYRMRDVERISDMLYNDESLIIPLKNYETGWNSYERMADIIIPKFNIAMNATGLNIAMYIFLSNETLPERYYGSFESEDPDQLERIKNTNIFHLNRIEDKVWHKNFPEEKFGLTMEWQRVERDYELGRISLLRRLVDLKYQVKPREIGFMRISLRKQELFEAIDYSKIGEGSTLWVTDEQGSILYMSGRTPDYANMDNYLIIKDSVGRQNWELTAYVPLTVMETDSARVKMFIIAICLLCLVVFTFAGMFISRYFSIRMNKVVSVLNAYREGELHKRMGYQGNDEFSEIASALNEMGQNINHLIEEVYMTQIEKKEAELESLQAQINPHFLYNTLSSISRLAKFGEIDKLQRMVLDLAKFYRLSLNEGRTLIPVSSELEQAEAYINIQRTKFGDAVTIDYDIDPAIVKYETIKLILQPFIENAFEHARMGDSLNIRIVGRLEGKRIVFKIIDNGVGMPAERIRQIFDPIEGLNTGFGIRNVHSRIQLHFGSDYGVKIGSGRGIGTTVQIVIPAREIGKVPVDRSSTS